MQIDKKFMQKELVRDGSVLKGIRSLGGMALGCMAGGGVLLGAGVFLGLFALLASPAAGLAVLAFFGVPGLLLILWGRSSRKKRMNSYLDYYQEESGYSKEELQRVDQELQEPETLAIGAIDPQVSKKVPVIGCLISRNYVVMVQNMGLGYVRRIEDLAAAAYSQKIPGINGYKWGLVFIGVGDKECRIDARMDQEACAQIARALSERNPWVITAPAFISDGKQYDIIKDAGAVVELYRQKREQG